MRRKHLFLPVLLVFIFALSFSFTSTLQEATAGPACPDFGCAKFCVCQMEMWTGVWDSELEFCDIETNCFDGPCNGPGGAGPCM